MDTLNLIFLKKSDIFRVKDLENFLFHHKSLIKRINIWDSTLDTHYGHILGPEDFNALFI